MCFVQEPDGVFAVVVAREAELAEDLLLLLLGGRQIPLSDLGEIFLFRVIAHNMIHLSLGYIYYEATTLLQVVFGYLFNRATREDQFMLYVPQKMIT